MAHAAKRMRHVACSICHVSDSGRAPLVRTTWQSLPHSPGAVVLLQPTTNPTHRAHMLLFTTAQTIRSTGLQHSCK